MKTSDLIIGAGPAGLTAAYELLEAGQPAPLIVESDRQVGGISKTIDHGGNRMDLGGHRFFSKSDWVMDWWQRILPIQSDEPLVGIAYQNAAHSFQPARRAIADDGDAVMLVRSRLSRIFYRRRFFDYPVKLNGNTVQNLGLPRMARIGLSYAAARVVPRAPESSLEDFLVNRFGRELYMTFFRDYTEKVWGVPCTEISAEWGAQRIKGLSITKALTHALQRAVRRDGSVSQRDVETSLIERFLYPKFGPGQLWETVAERVKSRGTRIMLEHRVVQLRHAGGRVVSADVRDERTGLVTTFPVRNVVSTMPIRDLAQAFAPAVPDEIRHIATGIPYRDFMTVGLLVDRMRAPLTGSSGARGTPNDNWIYIQEPDVKIGRLQIFNNWSTAMVAAHPKVWLGLEYFCNEGDGLWSMADGAFAEFAASELAKIGLIDRADVRDARVVRVPKAYPAYFGTYAKIDRVRDYFDSIPNLYLVGRNGMHRYNNQDHSMLSAKAAVDVMLSGSNDKSPLWAVNAEDEYHEVRRAS
jgi:protoporphyrinogen oxidase